MAALYFALHFLLFYDAKRHLGWLFLHKILKFLKEYWCVRKQALNKKSFSYDVMRTN